MDDEKLQRTIEFILNNQAQFTVDIQKINDAHRDAEKRIHTLEKVSLNLYNTTVELGKNINQLSKDVQQMRETSEREMGEMRAAQKETGERLNAVIMMVEKFLDKRNGK